MSGLTPVTVCAECELNDYMSPTDDEYDIYCNICKWNAKVKMIWMTKLGIDVLEQETDKASFFSKGEI